VILPMVTALGDGERAAIALAKTAGHVVDLELCVERGDGSPALGCALQ
jgi:hypothetical protein